MICSHGTVPSGRYCLREVRDVSDCLETIIEIGEEYKNLFIEHGGTELDLVPSLNMNADWVNYLADKIKSY